MFKGPTVQPQRPTPPGGGQQPSEFTKLFNSPLPETPLAARLEKPEAELKPAASFNEPGDFTKMFGRPNQNSTDWNASANPQSAGARTSDLGAATGIFSKKNVFESTPPQPTLAGGPSEYTRMFQAGAGPAEVAAGPASAQAEQKVAPSPPVAKKQTQSVPIALIVILAAIAVVAIALILYFVFKR
jgi:cobalamin biosynthesis Mg chelatase CobN